jgi:sugar/nucleoside kinase (ribokinase family)
MSLVAVGSMALDSIETPAGRRDDVWGGSATYFAASASLFTRVSLVAVVGEDFPQEILDFLRGRDVGLEGISRSSGKTFRWRGRYGRDLGDPETLDTRLGVFEHFQPSLPEGYRDAGYVFLANIDPDLQREVLGQVARPKIVACDTMNFWIEGKTEALKRTLQSVDLLVINDGEARALAGDDNLVRAARRIMEMGPSQLIVKRGEYGVVLFSRDHVFAAPAFPLSEILDPTGAGDTFAGGLMGYLASLGRTDPQALRQAMVVGTVMASFTVEGFSLDRIRTLETREIAERLRAYRDLTTFEEIPEPKLRQMA